MSDTTKGILLTDEEMDEIISKLDYVEVSTYPITPMHMEINNRTMREAIARAQARKIAEWIEKQTQDVSTDVPTRESIVKALREAAGQ